MTLMIMVFSMTFVFSLNGWGWRFISLSLFILLHGLVWLGVFCLRFLFIYHGFLILSGVERSDLYFLDFFLLFPWTHWAVALALILWLV